VTTRRVAAALERQELIRQELERQERMQQMNALPTAPATSEASASEPNSALEQMPQMQQQVK